MMSGMSVETALEQMVFQINDYHPSETWDGHSRVLPINMDDPPKEHPFLKFPGDYIGYTIDMYNDRSDRYARNVPSVIIALSLLKLFENNPERRAEKIPVRDEKQIFEPEQYLARIWNKDWFISLRTDHTTRYDRYYKTLQNFERNILPHLAPVETPDAPKHDPAVTDHRPRP